MALKRSSVRFRLAPPIPAELIDEFPGPLRTSSGAEYRRRVCRPRLGGIVNLRDAEREMLAYPRETFSLRGRGPHQEHAAAKSLKHLAPSAVKNRLVRRLAY